MASSLLTKLQPFSSANSVVLDDIEGLSCPICLEIYEKPRKILCGHVFCKACLNNFEDILEPACPVCRQLFTLNSAKKASDMEKTIIGSSWICRGCNEKVPLSKLRYHNSSCAPLLENLNETCPVVGATADIATPKRSKSVPNRHTFRCPYCGLQNLDTHALLTHCNDNHRGHPGQVVCPICASMPWGNSRQKSSNFISHLNLRHRFEYSFVVDFSLDDQAALDKALQASVEEQ